MSVIESRHNSYTIMPALKAHKLFFDFVVLEILTHDRVIKMTKFLSAIN